MECHAGAERDAPALTKNVANNNATGEAARGNQRRENGDCDDHPNFDNDQKSPRVREICKGACRQRKQNDRQAGRHLNQ